MDKLKNIKIAFIDIDGTLTNSQNIITDETLKVLRNVIKNGINVVLCSGRTNEYVCDFSNKVGNISYAISSNGAEIYDINRDIDIFENHLDFREIEKLWNYAYKNSIGFLANTKHLRYGNKYLKNTADSNKKIIEDINLLKSNIVYQIIIASNS